MNTQQKIVILNKTANTLRETLREIDAVFQDDKDVLYFIWKINKDISLMHQAICKKLEKEITDEEFNKIIKGINGD